MPYAEAVLTSFPHALAYLRRFLRWEVGLGLLAALPFLYRSAEGRACSFRYPLGVTLLSFCAYACQFTPHLVAFSGDGPDRLMNIVYFASFWLIGGNCYYWCGWLAKKKKTSEAVRVFARWTAVAAAAALVIFAAISVARDPNALNSASAANSLMNGQAARYGEALAERGAAFEDQSVTGIVTVPPLPHPPCVLKDVELSPHFTHDWLNGEIARYYGKEKIIVLWPTE